MSDVCFRKAMMKDKKYLKDFRPEGVMHKLIKLVTQKCNLIFLKDTMCTRNKSYLFRRQKNLKRRFFAEQ